jgi:hypothetical protein
MAQPMAVSKPVHSAVEVSEGLSEVSTEEMYREILSRLGEDPSRQGLQATPARVEKAMAELTKGYDEDPTQILRGALFDEDYDEMVIVKGHRNVLALRTSHAALFRQSARGIHSQGARSSASARFRGLSRSLRGGFRSRRGSLARLPTPFRTPLPRRAWV